MSNKEKMSVEEYLNNVNYDHTGYIPKDATLGFFNFMKLVAAEAPESNKTPVTHMKLMDNVFSSKTRLAILCHRGFSKSTLLTTYLILYIAVFGKMDNFGTVNYILCVLDSQEGGAKTVRRALETAYNNSTFLQRYITDTRFTDAFIELENADGDRLGVKLVGAQMTIRGTRFANKRGSHRPELAIIDDILSDVDARSPTVVANIENTLHKAVDKALDPNKNKIIYIGTVFNSKDPLYKVIESGRWSPSVYPVCERFPCTREDFRGSWEDRFNYDVVKRMYDDAVALGRMSDFNGEMMNRVISDEERIITTNDVRWYKRTELLKRKDAYNFYITTDFATSEKSSSDFSVLMVWAISSGGQWFLVDGICKRQLMDKNIDDLFRLVQMYRPVSTGVEVSGQQGGFIQWIKNQMIERSIFFSLATDNNGNKEGIRPVTRKYERFLTVEPWFKLGLMHFPEELRGSNELVDEAIDELHLITPDGFKSKHDDVIDCISMLSSLTVWKPSEVMPTLELDNSSGLWVDNDGVIEVTNYDSYTV